jgi:hypothetical protein
MYGGYLKPCKGCLQYSFVEFCGVLYGVIYLLSFQGVAFVPPVWYVIDGKKHKVLSHDGVTVDGF